MSKTEASRGNYRNTLDFLLKNWVIIVFISSFIVSAVTAYNNIKDDRNRIIQLEQWKDKKETEEKTKLEKENDRLREIQRRRWESERNDRPTATIIPPR